MGESERKWIVALWWRRSEMGVEMRISSFCSRVWLEKWWEKDDGMTRYGGIVTRDGHGVCMGGNLCHTLRQSQHFT